MKKRSIPPSTSSLPPTRQAHPTWQAGVLLALALAVPAWIGLTLLDWALGE